MSDAAPDFETLKPRLKATWMAGDFGEIAKSIESHAEDFIARRHIAPGMRVLDAACGTGNTALLAARRGAGVTGVDIASNLLQQARERADREGLEVAFEEGDVEDLPYDDASFDLVLSMYGVMFAPRPERAAAELVRVCRPGGQIVLANWRPDGFIARMSKVTARHVPPPAGLPSPLLWGDEATVRERLADGVREIRATPTKVVFAYPVPPADTVAFYRTYYGPTKNAFAALSEDDGARLQQDLEELWAQHNRADDGTTNVETEYLEVVATRASA